MTSAGWVPWLRLDSDVLDDPRVVRAVRRHGAVGFAAWIVCLTTAKLQRQAGRIELSGAKMARDLNADEEDCEAALTTLVEVGLLVVVEDDTYEVPRWVEYQPDEQSRAAQAKRKALHPGRKPGRPRKSDVIPRNPTLSDETKGPRTKDHGPTTTGPTTKDQRPRTEEGSNVSGPTSSRPSSFDSDADSVAECEHLAAWIVRNGSKRPTITAKWMRDAERLRRIDGRTHEQVMAAIDWCQQDGFWRSNILSMGKLREKFDQLRLAAGRPAKPTGSEIRAAIERGEA